MYNVFTFVIQTSQCPCQYHVCPKSAILWPMEKSFVHWQLWLSMTIVNVTRVYKGLSYKRVPLKLVFSHPLTTYTSTPIPSKKSRGIFPPQNSEALFGRQETSRPTSCKRVWSPTRLPPGKQGCWMWHCSGWMMLGRDFSHKSLSEMLGWNPFLPSSNQWHYFNGRLRKVVIPCKWVPGDAENLTTRHGKIGLDMSGV